MTGAGGDVEATPVPEAPPNDPDPPSTAAVVVIGGGICGLATAYELARRGVDAVLLERHQRLGAEATLQNFGSLRTQGRHPAESEIAVDALARWREAESRFDPKPGIVSGGNLYLAQTAAEAADLDALIDTIALDHAQVLDPRAVRELVPLLTGEVAAGLFTPTDAHCEPQRAVDAYAAAARSAGARIHTGVAVRSLIQRGNAVRGVRTTAGDVGADAVVVTAGITAPELLRPTGLSIPIKPVSYSSAETTRVDPIGPLTIRAHQFSCRQTPDGRLYLGAGLNARVGYKLSLLDPRELRDLSLWVPALRANRRRLDLRIGLRSKRGRPAAPPTNLGLLQTAHAALGRALPLATQSTIRRAWAGWLDLSPDGLPVIGAHRKYEGLSYAAALSGHGFALAPAIGVILADLVEERRTPYPIEPLRLERFSERIEAPRRLV